MKQPAEKNISVPADIISLLEKRKALGLYRELKSYSGLVDFCSNDYLGLAQHTLFFDSTISILKNYGADKRINGSGGSRLLSGNSTLVSDLEEFIAEYHNVEAALVFNSGYDANIGFFSSLPQQGDTVIYDELIHASIHDGIKLGKAKSYMFKHNDVSHLEERLKIASGNIYVAVESVYSMDGDASPLKEIAGLCKRYGANLVVDEAHATGIFGENGKGLVSELQLESVVFARIHTFGKALGCHGAAALGSKVLKNYLINYARSFIYTTALPPHSVAAIMAAYKLLPEINLEVKQLKSHISKFRNFIQTNIHLKSTDSISPIQCIIIPGNEDVCNFSNHLLKHQFDVRPVYSPTVPKGKERVRICLHSFNTDEELDGLFSVISNYQ